MNLLYILKPIVILLQKIEKLSSLGVRLTKLTGKSRFNIHPKNLIKTRKKFWFDKYILKNGNLLDIGCGVGSKSIHCSKKLDKVYGFDFNEKHIEICKSLATKNKVKNVSFFVWNAEKRLPFEDGFFSTILNLNVLEHINNRNNLLEESYRLLKEGGLLILTLPNKNTFWKKIQKRLDLFYYSDSDHKIEYSKQEIISILKNHNFEIKNISLVTYDSPFKGIIDIIGGISIKIYQFLSDWRNNVVRKYPNDSIGFKIIAKKK
ncbi:MAG: methyltransferase domain-containing protein [Candidatus Lokiarchaeota archaeon]|nr:methyltransferase domain-containing protein [Candidatus Lokiarchaeota archaeon]